MARLPDFIIIGAQRSGTTSLYATLGQHPDIGLSNGGELDEIHFFANIKRYKRSFHWYKAQFESNKKLVGEKSPMYLQHSLAPRRMKRVIKAPRLIVMLRNPIDRAYSNYRKAIAKGFVDGTFEEALEIEDKLSHPEYADWVKFWGSDYHLFGFKSRGYYAEQLKRWFEMFKRERFHIIRSEDFYKEPAEVVKACFEFLEAEPVEVEIKHLQNLAYQPMESKTRKQLAEHFKQKNEELYELLGRDMEWK